MDKYILELREISKYFPGVKALDKVNLSLRKGEIHALIGENGAGKSTLMNVLGGILQPDEGQIVLNGEKVEFKNAQSAVAHGIGVVFQELSVVPQLSIAENIFSNRQPVTLFNFIKWKEMNSNTLELLKRFDQVDLEPQKLVKYLSIGEQQIVEILKAMSFNPQILVFDEPTSSLTQNEKDKLFENINQLKSEGISIIYISHHLREILEIADRATILRDGQYVTTEEIQNLSEDKMVKLMVGREVTNIFGSRESEIGAPLFEVQNLSKTDTFENISFQLNKGEILGLAGLVGAGRTEIGKALFGVDPAEKGDISIEGRKVRIKNVEDAIDNDIVYLTEDRKQEGLYLNMRIDQNFSSPSLKRYMKKFGFLDEREITQQTNEYINLFNVRTPSVYQKVNNLSGGNQQKVLLSTWVGTQPKVLIVDEPTRGVDVGAKSEIYMHLRKLAAEGIGIIVISSDLPEIMGLSDRILVIRDGQIADEISAENATEEKVIGAASGVSL